MSHHHRRHLLHIPALLLLTLVALNACCGEEPEEEGSANNTDTPNNANSSVNSSTNNANSGSNNANSSSNNANNGSNNNTNNNTNNANNTANNANNACIPSAEVCDGADNDCDGAPDQENAALLSACVARPNMHAAGCAEGVCVLACDEGHVDANQDPTLDGCECQPAADGLEVCNGVDDDCDGAIDEADAASLLDGCGVREGAAPSACEGGRCVWSCAEGAVDLDGDLNAPEGGDCECLLTNSGDEVCDQLDNDCDGLTDEEIEGCCAPGDAQPCGVAVGVCAIGEQRCGDDRAWGACLDDAGQPVLMPGDRQEVCNQLDDDCDGSPDEGFADSDGDGIGDDCDRCDGRLYGGQIVLDPNAPPELIDVAEDELARWLMQMTGQPFTVTTPDAMDAACRDQQTGIFLMVESAAFYQAGHPAALDPLVADLEGRSTLAFAIHDEPGRGLWIVQEDGSGVSRRRHPMYFVLEQLGFRALAPGDAWIIAPPRQDARVPVSRVVEPDITDVFIAGTGGFGGTLPVDRTNRVQSRWTEWTSRRQLPGEFALNCGHTGEMFNQQQANAIKADPLHLAEYLGVRQMLPDVVDNKQITKLHYTHHGTVPCDTPGARLSFTDSNDVEWCEDPSDYTSQGGGIDLYTDWTNERIRLLRAMNPPRVRAWISVEPADGRRHCDCWKCRALLREGPYGPLSADDSSVSDRVFHHANRTQLGVQQVYPDVSVCLLAYNEHAAVPDIPLEEGMFVRIAAYAFHTPYTHRTAAGLLDDWLDKANTNPAPIRLGIYDYWGIPDWTFNLPNWSVSRIPTKLTSWQDHALRHVGLESTYATGAMGLQYYLATRLFWDAHAEPQSILDEFYRLAFGVAEPPMRRMLERWNRGFQLNPIELSLSYQDLLDAYTILDANPELDPAWRLRVDQYALYVRYLRLRYEYQALTGEASVPAADRLLQHIWRIYDSMMVHTYRLHTLIIARGALPQSFKDRWNVDVFNAAGWSMVTPYTADQIRQFVTTDAALYPLVDGYMPPAWSNDLVPLFDASTLTDDTCGDRETVLYYSTQSFALHPQATIPNRLQLHSRSPSGFLAVSIENPEGIVIREEILEGSAIRDLDLGELEEGLHRLRVQALGTDDRYAFVLPQRLAFSQLGPFFPLSSTQSAGGRNFFFVPPGVTEVFIQANIHPTATPDVYAPTDYEDNPVQLTRTGSNLFSFNTAGMDGQVWLYRDFITTNYAPVILLNVPDIKARLPQQLLVPRELRPAALPAPPVAPACQ